MYFLWRVPIAQLLDTPPPLPDVLLLNMETSLLWIYAEQISRMYTAYTWIWNCLHTNVPFKRLSKMTLSSIMIYRILLHPIPYSSVHYLLDSYFVGMRNSNMLYAFFWVIPQHLNFICLRFGTRCLSHLHRQTPTRLWRWNRVFQNVGI
jgi:hypothetical protein